MTKKTFALVDCNNFFVSCERAFRPDLEKIPVIVLSNNDGCVISRSEEAKKLGITMGMPYFLCKDFLKKNNVAVFSSNFSLYGDMSRRVMEALQEFTDKLEIYSIDEAFLELDSTNTNENFAGLMRKTIRQWTRIPVSIGIAPTKVLAKLASHIAKKNLKYQGVFDFQNKNVDEYLKDIFVGEVWGIGRKHTEFLVKNGIRTALEFKNAPDHWVKKNLKSVGLSLARELRGFSCLPIEEVRESKKSIMSTRSFGKPVKSIHELIEAVATYTERAAEKLREEGLVASYIYVYIRTSFHTENKFSAGKGKNLNISSAYSPLLIKEALSLLENIYKEGYEYYKAGVHLLGLSKNTEQQQNLFEKIDSSKHEKIMNAVDVLNKKFGKEIIQSAASGFKKLWSAKRDFISKHYTTSFNDLPVVK